MARCKNPIPPESYLKDFCDKPREGDEEAQYTMIRRGGALCEPITLIPVDGRDKDREVLDCWNQDFIDQTGTLVYFFSLDLQKSVRDPLYDEAIKTWSGPYEIKGVVQKPQKNTTALEEGLHAEFGGDLYLSRTSVENLCMPRPKEGDVVLFWDLPFYADFGSLNSTDISRAGFYFDVTQVRLDGHMFDSPEFAGFSMELVRRTSFTPERRVYGDGPKRQH